jgi:hypothetical protein
MRSNLFAIQVSAPKLLTDVVVELAFCVQQLQSVERNAITRIEETGRNPLRKADR